MVLASVALFFALLGLLVLFLGLAQRHRHLTPRLPVRPARPASSVQLERLQRTGQFRGVRIESRCAAAVHLIGREYDFDTAPELPLPGCQAEVCKCGYAGLPERRSGSERRSWTDRRQTVRADSSDRRAKRPRRKADLAVWATHGRL
jgi:hypothetical protein